jgi:chaperone modulatory protein CbpM
MAEKSEVVIFADYSHAERPLSLREFLEITHLAPEQVHELVHYDIIHPATNQLEQWQFDLQQLQRATRALRLQRDLEVNLAGVAILLDLLDEMENMRAQLSLMEKLYGK